MQSSPEASAENTSAETSPVAPPSLPGITLSAKPLSSGPLTAVYRGWDRSRRCDVAVKVQRVTDNPTALARFRREAELLAGLHHPGIVTLYHFYDGDPAALVMEYVSGQTLLALVKASGPLSPERAVQIIEEVASALDCLHAQDIIHRDITPANILLARAPLPFRHGSVKLTDFGVARIEESTPLTILGDILGTIEYVSPEQVHGSVPPDARSDIYSLAAVTYFALTGTPPFRPADDSTSAKLSVMHRQVFAEPPPLRLQRPDLTPQMEQIVLRGLAKAPEARYASAGQFAAALRAVIGASPSEDRILASASRRTGLLAGSLAGAAALLLGAILLWKTEQSTPLVPAASSGPVASSTVPPAVSVPPSPTAPIVPPVKPTAAKPAHIPRIARAIPRTHQEPSPMPVRRLALIRKRRLERVIAATPMQRVIAAVPKPAARRPGFLLIYASQNTAPLGRVETMASIPARDIIVDGKSIPVPPPGGWIALPAGRHWISFYPDARSKFGPSTRLPVSVAAGSHVRKQVLLPLAIDRPVTLVADAPAAAPTVPIPASPIPTPPVPIVASVPVTKTAAAVGWYTVSGWLAVPQTGRTPALVRTSAQQVFVDGTANLTLALGQWAELPAGKHTITFQPTHGVPVAPKTWEITLDPLAHLNQQIPLPPVTPLPAP